MKNFIASLVNNGLCNFATSNGAPARHRAKRFTEVGCEIRIPKDAPLLVKHTEFSDPNGFSHEIDSPVLPVEYVYPDGERQNDILFIGSLVKSVMRADHTLVRAQGSVAEFMDSCDSLDEQLEGLRGRVIRVSAMTEVENYRGRRHRVYYFDFV